MLRVPILVKVLVSSVVRSDGKFGVGVSDMDGKKGFTVRKRVIRKCVEQTLRIDVYDLRTVKKITQQNCT